MRAYDALTTTISGLSLHSQPAGAVVLWNVPGSWQLASVFFARLSLLGSTGEGILAASTSLPREARGLRNCAFLWHAVAADRSCWRWRGLVSIAGVRSDSGQALCGLAGVGQLAWQAALARDLHLLTSQQFL